MALLRIQKFVRCCVQFIFLNFSSARRDHVPPLSDPSIRCGVHQSAACLHRSVFVALSGSVPVLPDLDSEPTLMEKLYLVAPLRYFVAALLPMVFLLFRNAVSCPGGLSEVPSFILQSVFEHGLSLASATAFLTIVLLQPHYPAAAQLPKSLIAVIVSVCCCVQAGGCFLLLAVSENNPWISLKCLRIFVAGIAM